MSSYFCQQQRMLVLNNAIFAWKSFLLFKNAVSFSRIKWIARQIKHFYITFQLWFVQYLRKPIIKSNEIISKIIFQQNEILNKNLKGNKSDNILLLKSFQLITVIIYLTVKTAGRRMWPRYTWQTYKQTGIIENLAT